MCMNITQVLLKQTNIDFLEEIILSFPQNSSMEALPLVGWFLEKDLWKVIRFRWNLVGPEDDSNFLARDTEDRASSSLHTCKHLGNVM